MFRFEGVLTLLRFGWNSRKKRAFRNSKDDADELDYDVDAISFGYPESAWIRVKEIQETIAVDLPLGAKEFLDELGPLRRRSLPGRHFVVCLYH